MHYYPFHIGDFRSGTVNMSRKARWIYRDMLDIYYDSEQPLTSNVDALCELLGADDEEDRRIVERHLRFKFELVEDGYRHHVCDSVIAEYHSKAETARANGRLGGRPRKNREKPSGFLSGSDPVATANPVETGSQANQEPITNNHKPITSKAIGASAPVDDAFELAWKAYPKREGANPKNKALAAWNARMKEGVTAEAMLVGVMRYEAFCKAKGNVGTGYVMQAVRFFGTERAFDNEWSVSKSAGKPNGVHHGFDQIDYNAGLVLREDGTHGL